MLGKVTKKPVLSLEVSAPLSPGDKPCDPNSPTKPQDVDSKIAEQLRLFENKSPNETTKEEEGRDDELPDLSELKMTGKYGFYVKYYLPK